MQKVYNIEQILVWLVRLGVWVLLFTPLIFTGGLFFPYTTGKNFFFRIVVEIIFGAWLGLAVLKPSYRPRKGPILYTFSVFVGVLTLATIFGADPYRSLWSNFERMEGLVTHLHLFALFLVASSVFTRKQEWARLFTISLGVSLIVSFIGLLESMGAVTLGGSVAGSVGVGRIFSTLGNSTFLAAYLLVHLFIAGYLFTQVQSQMLRVAYAGIFLFELYILIESGTRGALLGFVAGTVVTAGLVVFFSQSTYVRRIGLAGVGIILFLALGAFAIRDTQFIQSRPLLSRLTDFDFTPSSPVLTTSSTLRARIMVWGMAWDSFRARPLSGWGPGNFIIPYTIYHNPHYFGNEEWSDRVHNMFLEWLVAGGVLAFSAYIAFFATLGVTLWRLKKSGVLNIGATAVLAGLGVAYLVQDFFAFDTIAVYILATLLVAFLHVVPFAGAGEKQTYPAGQYKEWRLYLAPTCVAVGLLLAYILNARPMALASGINDVFYLVARDPAGDFVQRYDAVRAQGGFGLTELREQFALYAVGLLESDQTEVSAEDKIRLISKSIEEMEIEVHAHPQSVRSLVALGKLRQVQFLHTKDENHKSAALGAYAKALEMAPRFPQSSIGLAETYLSAGEPGKAVEAIDSIYRHIVVPNPLFGPALLTHVTAADFEGSVGLIHKYLAYADVLPIYEGGVYMSPEDAEEAARRALGRGDPEAREQFLITLREAMGPSNNNAVVFFALAQTQAELGKKEEARASAARAINADHRIRHEVREFLETIE